MTVSMGVVKYVADISMYIHNNNNTRASDALYVDNL